LLDNERYLSLVTFRRDGREVATPIWFAEDAGRLVAFTLRDSGKVKRLRNSPRARFAACDARGRVHGPWRDATARVVSEPAAVAGMLEHLHRKYGWLMGLADFFSRLSGRYSKRAYLEIVPTS